MGVGGVIQNSVLGQCFLVWDCFGVQIIIFQNISCSALRAMTGHEGESADILFGIVMQHLRVCGAIHNFDYPSGFDFAAQRSSNLLTTF